MEVARGGGLMLRVRVRVRSGLRGGGVEVGRGRREKKAYLFGTPAMKTQILKPKN